ncbi:MAG: nuclease-related domain-containing protein [Anaerolineae bacterium]|nr:nuclease-related domain-containing protein [Anaerolineae bacterium]
MAHIFVHPSRKEVPDIPLELLKLLASLDDTHFVFLSLYFGREADVVIFTRNSVHVVEVKDKRGTVRIDDKDNWTVDGEPIVNEFAGEKENPVTQAKRVAEGLQGKLRQFYRKRLGKEFAGSIYPYVLIPFASEATKENLRGRSYPWVRLVTSLNDLISNIARRDEQAKTEKDFYFTEEELRLLASHFGMIEKDVVNGVRIKLLVTSQPEALENQTARASEKPQAVELTSSVSSHDPVKESAASNQEKRQRPPLLQSPWVGVGVAVAVILSVLALIILTTANTPRGCISAARLNVREVPFGRSVGVVTKGECFTFDARSADGNWVRISTIGKFKGTWVASRYVDGLKTQDLPVVRP